MLYEEKESSPAARVSVDNGPLEDSLREKLFFMGEQLLLCVEAIILEQLLVGTSGISSVFQTPHVGTR